MEQKKKSEKRILQEGFLTNFLSGVLLGGFIAGKKPDHEIVRGIDGEKKQTKDQVKKDYELKRLLDKFSSTSTDLYRYCKKNKDKGGAYERLYIKLSEFY